MIEQLENRKVNEAALKDRKTAAQLVTSFYKITQFELDLSLTGRLLISLFCKGSNHNLTMVFQPKSSRLGGGGVPAILT